MDDSPVKSTAKGEDSTGIIVITDSPIKEVRQLNKISVDKHSFISWSFQVHCNNYANK